MIRISDLLDRFHTYITPFDAVSPLSGDRVPGLHRANLLAALTLVAFAAIAIALVVGDFVDNKPTTASTGLVAAHRSVTLNPAGWFSEGIWWRGKQTPTPLPFTIHGAFLALFGYSIRGIMCLHILIGTLAAGLLFRITTRRYGSWPGLLALILYLIAPLPLYVTLSGWTFVWATMFLLLCIDLLDRAVLTRRIPYYLLAGLALGCAGMSRPENYAVSILVLVFVNIPIRYRVAFTLLAFLYPIAQYLHNNIYLGDPTGLRILDDSRSAMGYGTIFEKWFKSIHRLIIARNFAFLKWLLIPAVVFFGPRHHRFLTAVLAYFCVALFAAYAMRRISFNHEGYYYAHVTLAMPFLAAFLVWILRAGATALQKARVPQVAATGIAIVSLVAVLAVNAYALRESYDYRLFSRVPESVREVRDFLRKNLRENDRLALDYFREVSWMMAEIEGPKGRDVYFYSTNQLNVPRPPLNPARKDITPDEQAKMNAWVGNNYRAWCDYAMPRYVVTQSDSAWARERDRKRAMGHYRMFSLRPALGTDTADDRLLPGRVVLENGEFLVIERVE
jgi:hypothetical protein